jgi:peptidoglycan/LPS O-acetylase OafA/YrhL
LLHDERRRKELATLLRPLVWSLIATALAVSIFYYSNLTSLLIAITIPVVLAGTVLHPTWLFSRVLQLPVLAWIGRISYSLYLWQQIFLVPGWEHGAPLQRWPFNLITVFGIATLSYYGLERPAMRIGRQLAARIAESRRERVVAGSSA